MDIVIENDDRVLIVAPHQDDETFGCGGFMAKYGSFCDVLLLTDGCLGNIENIGNEEELVRTRNAELEKACEIASVRNIFHLNIRNEELPKHKKEVYGFDIRPYKYIFVPNRKEDHIDHKVCYSIFSTTKRKQGSKAQIYEYEVWTPLTMPTVFFDISDVIDKKKEMIKVYQSQINDKDYYNGILGLNKYRGMFYNNEYCEAFKYAGYNSFTAGVYNMLPETLKALIRKVLSR